MGIELVIFLKNYVGFIHNYYISVVDIILAGGEVSSWSITERNGSRGEPWRAAAEVETKVILQELTEPTALSIKFVFI